MKKRFGIALMIALVLSLAVGMIASTTQAKPYCIATCLNGQLYVCCPLPGGGWDCFWDGPCNWGPLP